MDIVICAIPTLELYTLPAALGVLKGHIVDHGFSCMTVDLNIDLYEHCGKDLDKYLTERDLPNNGKTSELLDQYYAISAAKLLSYNARYIGVSLLSYRSLNHCVRLVTEIRSQDPTAKVIVGGSGLLSKGTTSYLGMANLGLDNGRYLAKNKLADFVVYNDGCDSLVGILNGTITQQFTHGSASQEYSHPNFDDTDLSCYRWTNGEPQLPVFGSKGCVRNCDFCNIPAMSGKFQSRDGTDVANEVIMLAQKYQVYKFNFTDSLVNGHKANFKLFVTRLAEHNRTAERKIKWNGQYINKKPNQLDYELYPLIAESGGEGLTIGAEFGSDRLLAQVKKHSSTDGLFIELGEFKKHGITCFLLTFTGHWDETWDDFLLHCKFLIRLAPYLHDGVISSIFLGPTAFLIHPTPASQRTDIIKLKRPDDYDVVWHNTSNPSNTVKERVFKQLIVARIGEVANIGQDDVAHFNILETLTKYLKTDYQVVNDFTAQHAPDQPTPAMAAYSNLDAFLASLFAEVGMTYDQTVARSSRIYDLEQAAQLLT